jgi:hypothetical protein
VTLARHPLDVLLSILHFSTFDESTSSWLLGEQGNEDGIFAAMPCSASFQEYAVGPRAAALLGLSRSWWSQVGCRQLRYEDLVENPAGSLQRLVQTLGVAATGSLDEALASNTLGKLRDRTNVHHHFWRGQPELWRHLLPAGPAQQAAGAHCASFALFGYACEPDANLTTQQADANWVRLVREDFSHGLRRFRVLEDALTRAQAELAVTCGQLTEHKSALSNTENELATLKTELATALSEFTKVRQELLQTTAELECTQCELAPFQALNPFVFELACRLQDLAVRFPRLAGAFKSIYRRTTGQVRP